MPLRTGSDVLSVVCCAMDAADSVLTRSAWVERFMGYVLIEVPDAPRPQLDDAAAGYHRRLGHYGPVEVAEAVWLELPFRQDVHARSKGRSDSSNRVRFA